MVRSTKHERTATFNLTQIILQNNTDVAFVNELYTVVNNMAGFPKSFKIFARGNCMKRSAIIVNSNIYAIAIKQVSHEDAILIEISYQGLTFHAASLYSPIDRDIEKILQQWRKSYSSQKGKG